MGGIVSHRIKITATIIMIVFGHIIYGQVLKQPILQFSAPCASDTYNRFNVEFSWDPPLVAFNNTFILELSDANGNFDNPTTLASYSDKNTIFKFLFSFGFPNTIYGENYKVRVKSTNPEKISPASNAFPAYYLKVNTPLVINNYVGKIVICDGSPANMQVNNYPSETAYRWYRNGTLLANEKKSSISTAQSGIYYVELDYGNTCSSATLSNAVEIISGQASGISINGATDIKICQGESYFLESSLNDALLTYQWFRNSQAVTARGYYPSFDINTFANPEGSWYLETSRSGGCLERTGAINVSFKTINASISNLSRDILLPGDIITLEVATNAVQPNFVWYKDNVVLTDATLNRLTTTQPGTYYCKVIEQSGCTVEKTTNAITIGVPKDFRISISTSSDYTDCQSLTTQLNVSSLYAILNNGSEIDIYTDFADKFNFQWYFDNNPITDAISKTLNLNGPEQNGSYYVKATFNDYSSQSNSIAIKLGLLQEVLISSTGSISCDGSSKVTITSNVENSLDYSYAWYLNGSLLPNQITSSLETNESGVYKLAISTNECTVYSNELTINPLEINSLIIDADANITITEGNSRLITASGADSYEWYRTETQEFLSFGASLNITEAGSYTVVATVNGCELTKTINVSYLESFVVPNVISPNADGYNDQWILPNSYAFKPNVEISIFSSKGEIIYKTSNYQNNWPQNNSSIQVNTTEKPIFFYQIIKENAVVKKGTITVIH